MRDPILLRKALISSLLIAFATPLYADVLYECTFTKYGKNNLQSFMSDKVELVEKDDGSAAVLDKVSKAMFKKPKAATLVTRKNKKKFSWAIRNVPTTGTSTVNLSSTIRFDTNSGKATYRLWFGGYDSDVNASGTCSKKK